MAAPESGLLVLSSRFVPLLSPLQITKQNHNKVKNTYLLQYSKYIERLHKLGTESLCENSFLKKV